MDLPNLTDQVDGLPNLSGDEATVTKVAREAADHPVYGDRSPIRLTEIDSAFAVALHMHQPLIPAAGEQLTSAGIIGNLQWMLEHPDIGDNHNASVFRWCYQRAADLVSGLLEQGRTPRLMLDYSGTLLHGLRQMGADDVLGNLRRLTNEPELAQCVEWLGCPWGHAVAPSTPVQDFRLHVLAWQQHFAALFGWAALERVRGFSPAEMALPNHPDVAYEFVRTLVDSGFTWVLVQEHTVELIDGRGLEHRHLPHRLVCTNSAGDSAEIVAVIKTQGSDTKLVGQMQPYYEARTLTPVQLAGRRIPPLVTQIADGENGGVMMNEFPGKYQQAINECSGSRTPAMNVTEYLEQVFATGLRPADLPTAQPVGQHRIWQEIQPGDGPQRLAGAIDALRAADDRFHVEGGSWTGDISWVKGYDNVLAPMERASVAFHERVTSRGVSTADPLYRRALFHLLSAQTSCYRYWGQGLWTDYGAEMSRRVIATTEEIG